MEIVRFDTQPVIRGARLTLRPVSMSDAGAIALYAGDQRVAEWTRSIPHPMPPGAAEAFIRQAQAPERSEDVWVIEGHESGLRGVLGLMGLERIDRGQSEIGYWVAPQFWRAGIASEAVMTLIGANPHHARTIFAEVFQGNHASARVLSHAGFDYLGDAEAFSVARNGRVATWTYLRRMGR